MFKITPSDLQLRSGAELALIFNRLNQGVSWLANPSPERSAALRLIAMIRAEQTRRSLWPQA